MSLPANTYPGTVHTSGLPASAWRVYIASSLFLLLVFFTDPRYNWPAGLPIAAGYVGLRWWEHHRMWHGQAYLQIERVAHAWHGMVAFDPPIDLLPETLVGMRAEVLDSRSRSRTTWEDWKDVVPQTAYRVLPVQFDGPTSWTSPPVSAILERRWSLALHANTPRGKLSIEFVIPETRPRTLQSG